MVDGIAEGIMKCELTAWMRKGIQLAKYYDLNYLSATVIPEEDEVETYGRLSVSKPDGTRETWTTNGGE